MAFGYDTCVSIINAALVECGVGIGNVTDPFASTDPAVLQMNQLLKLRGTQLMMMFDWQQLTKNYSFTTDGILSDYPLPTDFGRMIDQSGWERTNRVPLGGPMDSQDWQMVTNNNTLASIYTSFRIFGDVMKLFPRPAAAGLVVNYDYISRFWVAASGSTTGTKIAPAVASDVILFDSTVVVMYLKWKFKGSKGYDTREAKAEFLDVFGQVTGMTDAAAVLSLDNATLFPYLGDRNVPTTRYGI